MDEDKPTPNTSSAAGNVVRMVGLGTMIPVFLTSIPPTYALAICVVIVTCSAIMAAVPAPSANNPKVLIYAYQALRIASMGVKYAIPYMSTHLVKTPVSATKDTPK